MSTTSMNDLRALTISTGQLCTILGLSPQMISHLVKAGHLDRVGKNRFGFVNSVRGYAKFLQEGHAKQSEANARICDLHARDIEARIRMRLDRLTPIDDFADMVSIIAGLFLSEMAGSANRCGRNDAERAAIVADIAGMRQRIGDAIDRIGDSLPLSRPLGDAVRCAAVAAVESKFKS